MMGMQTKALVRGTAGLFALLAGATLTATASAAPTAAAATQLKYVALGDSYAAGTGAGSYLNDGTSCHRSKLGYPYLVAGAGGYALDLQACSGAIVDDVVNKQLGTLSASTAKVTLTIGGNDIGFSTTVSTCMGLNTTACLAAVDAANGKIITQLPGKLDTLLTAVKAKAPNARVVVTDYPRLFNGRDCSLLTAFTSTEMAAMNAADDNLATVIGDAAARNEVAFADVRTPFVRHALCDSTSWITNVNVLTQWASFHPNANGQRSGYTPTVSAAVKVTGTIGTTMTVTTGGQTSSDTNRGTVRVKP